MCPALCFPIKLLPYSSQIPILLDPFVFPLSPRFSFILRVSLCTSFPLIPPLFSVPLRTLPFPLFFPYSRARPSRSSPILRAPPSPRSSPILRASPFSLSTLILCAPPYSPFPPVLINTDYSPCPIIPFVPYSPSPSVLVFFFGT